MIVIHKTEVDYIKKRMEDELKKGEHMMRMFYMDMVQIHTILGLIEQYEAMKDGKAYKEGYMQGYCDAKTDAIKKLGGMKPNAGT